MYNEDVVKIAKETTYSYDPNGNLYSSVVNVLRPTDEGYAPQLMIGDDNVYVTMTINEYDVWNQLAKTSVTTDESTNTVMIKQ